MSRISDIQCFLLDMDGTFYLGNRLIEGSLEFISYLKTIGKRFIFLTNNSSKSSIDYVEKLRMFGCTIDKEDVFTSGEATTILLNQIKNNAKVFLLGTKALEDEFISQGFELTNDSDSTPDFVVLGFDQTLTYKKLWLACDFIREGIPYIATHPDLNCPLDGGKYMPDTGSMIELIKASTGKEPYVVGKPNSYMVEAICLKYGIIKENMAMVGDRLYTDIQMGINANVTSILVLSGETKLENYKQSSVKADYVFESLKELHRAILEESTNESV
jgi:HAD superfamily hydrolase (TIGR01457 family)